MKKYWGKPISIVWLAALAGLSLSWVVSNRLYAQGKPAAQKKTGAQAEKEKALQNPYVHDLGPKEIDAVVKEYPAVFQEGYNLMKARCAQCHGSQRPLNSRFVEPYVGDENVKDAAKRQAMKEAKIQEWKKSDPDLFAGDGIWQPEWNVWSRYVKRMMSKPGCNMTTDQGRKIWLFLTYDSSQRKIGKNKEAWKAHRRKLLGEFKEKYPKRYEELEKTKEL